MSAALSRAPAPVAALVALLGGLGAAAADGSRTKALPDKVTTAASDAFAAAISADESGDLKRAQELYVRAFAIVPHPNVMFNLGDVQRRLGALGAAKRSYETYLALAPGAPDRADVEKLIARIAATPGRLRLTTPNSVLNAVDFAAAYILIDGEIRRRPGAQPPLGLTPEGFPQVVLDAPPGDHRIDVVTSLTYATQQCKVKPGERTDCLVYAPPRVDGALVLSGDDPLGVVVTMERKRGDINERLTAPPGKQRLMVRDRTYECAPLIVDVPADDAHVAYAYLGTSEWDRLERCRRITLRQHTLAF